MAKKINKELKELIVGQIETEGFDYAMVEKISPDDWDNGVVPADLKKWWKDYLTVRDQFKECLRGYGIDPQ